MARHSQRDGNERIVASMLVFGYQGWPSFIHALADRESSLSPISQESMRLESVYGFLWLAGLSPPIAWAIQLAAAGAVAAVVCWVWARPLPHSLKAAALCSAAPMATPFVQGHDHASSRSPSPSWSRTALRADFCLETA